LYLNSGRQGLVPQLVTLLIWISQILPGATELDLRG
jgi:hypothetical protein